MEHTLLNWIQIPAENLERAANFYSKTFNVEFFFESLNDIPHAIFKENAHGKKPINGAIIQVKQRNTEAQGPVLFFEATGKFDMMSASIEQNGGKILVPKTLIKKKLDEHSRTIPNTYIDNMPGYFLHFLDSEGNKMGLYGSN